MCTLSSFFGSAMSSLKRSRPSIKLRDTKAKSGASMLNDMWKKQSSNLDYRKKRALINEQNTQRDNLFQQNIVRSYPVFKNALIPKYKRKEFLGLLEQYHPRPKMYQHVKHSALINKKSAKVPIAKKSIKKIVPRTKASQNVLQPMLKFGFNLLKRLFPH